MGLVQDVQNHVAGATEAQAILNLAPFDDFAEMAGALFLSVTQNPAVGRSVAAAYRADTGLVALTTYDIEETARRNFEPGGAAGTFLFARGIHAVMAHRVAHQLWARGDTLHALALKTVCGRALNTDMHPAAQIGAGLWLDHGLGFVVGETSVIEEDVSIWHNVTLGSTLNDAGPHRHPHIGRGAVIGAGAVLLGGIKVGAGANIGAGAIVVQDVADRSLVVGHKAQTKGPARISFATTDSQT